ncbi:unnamed protein product [Sympodiomycopsis kandeliae]
MENPPGLCPIYLPGKEPLPAGWTEDDRAALAAQKQGAQFFSSLTESCPAKAVLSGVAGFALGGFFSLLSTSLTIDDPLRRSNLQAAAMANGQTSVPELSTAQQTKEFFKHTGKGMYRSAKGFGKVGLLYAGIECCIEGYRAKNDMVNPIAGGFVTGGILARNAGPQGIMAGAVGFAAFSAAIDLYMRRQPSDEDE